MSPKNPAFAVLAAIALGFCLAAPACADDCAPVKAAMRQVVRTPHTITIRRIKDGKPVTSQMIQTKNAKYVEVKGKWHTVPFSEDDFREMEKSLDESTLTCTRVGRDTVNGTTATVYSVRIKNDDSESDAKLWLGADGLPLKSESNRDGGAASSAYDFAHADAPPNATPIGRQ
jgi:hypothetical protein